MSGPAATASYAPIDTSLPGIAWLRLADQNRIGTSKVTIMSWLVNLLLVVVLASNATGTAESPLDEARRLLSEGATLPLRRRRAPLVPGQKRSMA
jgi:hypothetical protein